MTNNEKNSSMDLPQEKIDILRNVIREARNAGLDDLTIRSCIFNRNTGKISSMEDFQAFSEIAERCGMGTIMEEDYMNPDKSYTGYSMEMIDAVDSLFQEGKSDDARGDDLNDYGNIRKPSVSQENVDILRNVIREARNAGLDDLTIRSRIFNRDTGKISSMEDFQAFSEIAERCGMGTIMEEDYMNPDKSYTGYSMEMIDAVDGLFQEKMESAKENTSSTKTISLTEFGKSAYQHFGKKVAEKLKQAFNAIKSKFLSKDKSQTNDLDISR